MFWSLWSAVPSFIDNLKGNLFKPLLMFFYMGFLVPILGVKLDFPHVIYQGLTIYLLIAIGWKGGEELALLPAEELQKAVGFMGMGFVTNLMIGLIAYFALRSFTKLRKVDAATVAGYYGSDSAGTFVTCIGVLTSAGLSYAPYMPVMLAVMEIPGCLVALFLVSQLRQKGMDAYGNMPEEIGYDPTAKALIPAVDEQGGGHQSANHGNSEGQAHKPGFSLELLHEVFLNPGIYLLFGGIIIGFVGQRLGPKAVGEDNKLFNELFQGLLCLFLLEMGMTASRKLRDLKTAGLPFVLFGVIAPNIFAILGMLVANLYSHLSHEPLEQGTYVVFAVLCAAASYIAVPAVQRLAIPEASPTLPLAASLGLTFTYNVTIGIPFYIWISGRIIEALPVK